jgi:hypothetical protein
VRKDQGSVWGIETFVALVTPIIFGLWQESWLAGVFMFAFELYLFQTAEYLKRRDEA